MSKICDSFELRMHHEIMICQGINFPRGTRRSERIMIRAIGAFQVLPLEIIHMILLDLPVSAVCQLALVSKCWNEVIREWMQWQSTAWHLAPIRLHVQKREIEEAYRKLGVLCRRVWSHLPMYERVLSTCEFLWMVETTSFERSPHLFLPRDLVHLDAFYKVSLPLCTRSVVERSQAVWVFLDSMLSYRTSIVLQDPAQDSANQDMTALRHALRVLVFSKTDRRQFLFALKATLWPFCVAEQAKLLYILFGPRSGACVDWTVLSSPTYTSLSHMSHQVYELACAVHALELHNGPEYVSLLVHHITHTPQAWRSRFEIILLIIAGPNATAAVLYKLLLDPRQRDDAITKMAHIVCLRLLYGQKRVDFEEEGIENKPIERAASFSLTKLFAELRKRMPSVNHGSLVEDVFWATFYLAIEIGGGEFALYSLRTLKYSTEGQTFKSEVYFQDMI